MSRARAALTTLLLAAAPGCSGLPAPFGDDDDSSAYPEVVQDRVAEIDILQAKGKLRDAIDLTERTLVDYPEAGPVRMRLAELRSQRQVCFVNDWSEADALLKDSSPNRAILALKRIERYGDPEMVRRARERIGEILASKPQI